MKFLDTPLDESTWVTTGLAPKSTNLIAIKFFKDNVDSFIQEAELCESLPINANVLRYHTAFSVNFRETNSEILMNSSAKT